MDRDHNSSDTETIASSLSDHTPSMVPSHEYTDQYPLYDHSVSGAETTTSSTGRNPTAFMVSPHELDDQYPFGDTDQYPISVNRREPKLIPASDRRSNQLINLLSTYEMLSKQETTSKEAHGQTLARCRQGIFDILKYVHAEDSTFGETFLTESRLSILSYIFKALYDKVVFSEELPGAHQGSDRLPMAQIRFKDDWDGKAPYARPIKLSDAHMEIMKSQLNELL